MDSSDSSDTHSDRAFELLHRENQPPPPLDYIISGIRDSREDIEGVRPIEMREEGKTLVGEGGKDLEVHR